MSKVIDVKRSVVEFAVFDVDNEMVGDDRFETYDAADAAAEGLNRTRGSYDYDKVADANPLWPSEICREHSTETPLDIYPADNCRHCDSEGDD